MDTQFVRDAVARGAAAVVIESGAPLPGVPFVVVEDSSKALALAAARFYGNPADAPVSAASPAPTARRRRRTWCARFLTRQE
jgi:UDP-N-acetylmuramyl tripeptide synthase